MRRRVGEALPPGKQPGSGRLVCVAGGGEGAHFQILQLLVERTKRLADLNKAGLVPGDEIKHIYITCNETDYIKVLRFCEKHPQVDYSVICLSALAGRGGENVYCPDLALSYLPATKLRNVPGNRESVLAVCWALGTGHCLPPPELTARCTCSTQLPYPTPCPRRIQENALGRWFCNQCSKWKLHFDCVWQQVEEGGLGCGLVNRGGHPSCTLNTCRHYQSITALASVRAGFLDHTAPGAANSLRIYQVGTRGEALHPPDFNSL